MRQALLGEEPPKEYPIGLEVFDKPETFDPKSDPIVRVQARRLRARLKDYYDSEGPADALIIELPVRGYKPVFRERIAAAADAQPSSAAATMRPGVNRRRMLLLAGAGAVSAGLAGTWLAARRTGAVPARGSSVAVLPFENLTATDGGGYQRPCQRGRSESRVPGIRFSVSPPHG